MLEDAQNLIMAERERWQKADAEVRLTPFHTEVPHVYQLLLGLDVQLDSQHTLHKSHKVTNFLFLQREMHVTEYKEAIAARLADANAKCLQLLTRVATLERRGAATEA